MPSPPRKRAERLKPVPLPKRKPLTKEELDARPPPKKAKKRSRSQASKLGHRRRKQRMPLEALENLRLGREKRLKDKEDNKGILVSLKTFHIFGTERFGPGRCFVPQRLVLAVLEQDRNAVEAEDQLFVSHAALIVRTQAGAVGIPVAASNFQSVWGGENPPIFDQVSGRGVTDAGQGARF